MKRMAELRGAADEEELRAAYASLLRDARDEETPPLRELRRAFLTRRAALSASAAEAERLESVRRGREPVEARPSRPRRRRARTSWIAYVFWALVAIGVVIVFEALAYQVWEELR